MNVLEVDGVMKSYRKTKVLRGVSLDVSAGTLVGVVGENGAGKSTLLKILAGELMADKGSVKLTGSVGYCPQTPVVNKSLTVSQHISYFKEAYHLSDTRYAEHLVGELHFKKFKGERVGNLSGGTLQKLNLVLALMHQPSVLLLDEPYQGFDWETYLRFWDLVKALKADGKAILIISHLIFEQKKFDRIWHLENGKIQEDEL